MQSPDKLISSLFHSEFVRAYLVRNLFEFQRRLPDHTTNIDIERNQPHRNLKFRSNGLDLNHDPSVGFGFFLNGINMAAAETIFAFKPLAVIVTSTIPTQMCAMQSKTFPKYPVARPTLHILPHVLHGRISTILFK